MTTDSSTPPTGLGGGSLPGIVALDIYGTVIDPAGIVDDLRKSFGTRAELAAQLWRDKQIELTFRRALMRKYTNFDVCTADALKYVSEQLCADLEENNRRSLLDAYLRLPAFTDVKSGLETLKKIGSRLIALTNGTEHSVRVLLQRAGISSYFEAIVSVDQIRTFKPDPAVYELVRHTAGDQIAWLVSSNPFDVAGAKACGLKAAWVRRNPSRTFDMDEFSPDLVVGSLMELCEALRSL
jgi:2-haloacid dehalogenase